MEVVCVGFNPAGDCKLWHAFYFDLERRCACTPVEKPPHLESIFHLVHEGPQYHIAVVSFCNRSARSGNAQHHRDRQK